MQHISFETKIENGYIKIPEYYQELDNQSVFVEITTDDIKEKPDREKLMEEFLQKYSGWLHYSDIPPDIDAKKIREMRLKERYGI